MLSHQSLEPADPYAKPAYSLDELKSFQQQENTAQLIFIAEQYLGRTLSPADMKSILFFTDKLHFSDDLIDYLLQYCVERGKKDFRYIEKVAIAWAEAGITTPAQAEGHVSRYDKNVYSIMNALGKTNTPARNELAYIRRWTEEFCFELDVILEACGRHRPGYRQTPLRLCRQHPRCLVQGRRPPRRRHRQTRQLLSERACISPGAQRFYSRI